MVVKKAKGIILGIKVVHRHGLVHTLGFQPPWSLLSLSLVIIIIMHSDMVIEGLITGVS